MSSPYDARLAGIDRSGKLNTLGWCLVAAALLAVPVVLLAFLIVAAHVGPLPALLGFFLAGLLASWAVHIGHANARAARR